MPVSPTYPGIYIQEAPSSSHTITAAPTNIAVFVGYTHPLKTLPANYGQAVQIFGFSDYQAQFGGFVRSAAFANAFGQSNNPGVFGDMAQAVSQFFLNGGTTAYIVTVNNNNSGPLSNLTPSMVSLSGGVLSALPAGSKPPSTGITFSAIEVTDELFAMNITIRPIPLPPSSPPGDPLADIIITYGPASSTVSPPSSPPASPPIAPGPGTVVETYRRVSLSRFQSDGKTENPNYIATRIGTSLQTAVSKLVTVSVGSPSPGSFPSTTATELFAPLLPHNTKFYNPSDYTAALQEDTELDKIPVFNLMVLPGIADNSATWTNDESGVLILSTAIAFCERKMAFLIMDPPIADTADGTVQPAPGTVPPPPAPQSNMIQNTMKQGSLPESKNAALYFPYLLSPDPITGNALNPVTGRLNEIPPAPTVAGIYAATDLARGVWKAPAGFQAQTKNVVGVVPRGRMTDQRQGVLNPLGVNCLRSFPNIPTVVFGSRTLVTFTDEQWRYVPVRRMALFLEQSLYFSLNWVVFEPNADPLWAAITMTINGFMLGLFKQGAFQGDTPSQAFNVQCNSKTTSQTDIDHGIVNIVVAFAPLKPAEFVIITIAQLAGQAQTA
jgi:uncharacterized protein